MRAWGHAGERGEAGVAGRRGGDAGMARLGARQGGEGLQWGRNAVSGAGAVLWRGVGAGRSAWGSLGGGVIITCGRAPQAGGCATASKGGCARGRCVLGQGWAVEWDGVAWVVAWAGQARAVRTCLAVHKLGVGGRDGRLVLCSASVRVVGAVRVSLGRKYVCRWAILRPACLVEGGGVGV